MKSCRAARTRTPATTEEFAHDGGRNPADAETLRASIARLPALPTDNLRASWEEDFDE